MDIKNCEHWNHKNEECEFSIEDCRGCKAFVDSENIELWDNWKWLRTH